MAFATHVKATRKKRDDEYLERRFAIVVVVVVAAVFFPPVYYKGTCPSEPNIVGKHEGVCVCFGSIAGSDYYKAVVER